MKNLSKMIALLVISTSSASYGEANKVPDPSDGLTTTAFSINVGTQDDFEAWKALNLPNSQHVWHNMYADEILFGWGENEVVNFVSITIDPSKNENLFEYMTAAIEKQCGEVEWSYPWSPVYNTSEFMATAQPKEGPCVRTPNFMTNTLSPKFLMIIDARPL